jgi:hypothetical protein
MSKKKDLVQIIRDNPGCFAIIDNDCWHLFKREPTEEELEADDSWHENNLLARDGEVEELGDGGYGSGHCYGGDLLQALAVIVGITVESV